MDLKETIVFLSAQTGPTGFEGPAMAAAETLVRPLVDELSTDAMGNLIGVRRCGEPGAPTVMLDAHMDEIGLIVTGYEQGFLRFDKLGGVDARMLPALEVQLLTGEGPLHGVVDVLPPHVVPMADREKPIAMDKLFIDAGFASEEEARARVPLGTPAAFSTPCVELGRHQLCGKSLDDRSCAAVLLDVLERTRDKPIHADLALHLAVQEEVGGRGALTGAYGIHPDYAIAVDVTHGRTPDAPQGQTMQIGGGAAIGVGPAMARKVSDRLEELARAKNIPYQIEVLPRSSGTDADEIQTTREGVATGVISLPLKYMHTPAEVIDLRDAQAVSDLLTAWLEDLGEENGNA